MSRSLAYIDESGDSGDVAGQPGAIAQQPSFVLAGIVEGDQTGAAEELVSQLRVDYQFQAKDLKWKSVAKKPRALVHLVRELRRRNVVPIVEAMSKWHYLASNIMTYVLGRRRIDFGRRTVRPRQRLRRLSCGRRWARGTDRIREPSESADARTIRDFPAFASCWSTRCTRGVRGMAH